jgi:hypothetical protein
MRERASGSPVARGRPGTCVFTKHVQVCACPPPAGPPSRTAGALPRFVMLCRARPPVTTESVRVTAGRRGARSACVCARRVQVPRPTAGGVTGNRGRRVRGPGSQLPVTSMAVSLSTAPPASCRRPGRWARRASLSALVPVPGGVSGAAGRPRPTVGLPQPRLKSGTRIQKLRT